MNFVKERGWAKQPGADDGGGSLPGHRHSQLRFELTSLTLPQMLFNTHRVFTARSPARPSSSSLNNPPNQNAPRPNAPQCPSLLGDDLALAWLSMPRLSDQWDPNERGAQASGFHFSLDAQETKCNLWLTTSLHQVRQGLVSFRDMASDAAAAQ